MSSTFSIVDAEKAFKRFGCLHFHMARELPDLYRKYQGMKITHEMESNWIREELYDVLKRLYLLKEELDNYWWMHSNAVKLAGILKDKTSLSCLYKITIKVAYLIPADSMIMCAEALLGSNDIAQKQSVVFYANEIGDKKLAYNFIELALYFIRNSDVKNDKRGASATERANKTTLMLR